ncbi:MAG: Crp/Fnr family transcriptional regulator [Gammaproteobacteria bacterium]|nr:Crp/Fnr family transcriptional regulator [Gammaproteobacteria bacterium]MBU1655563.1 Crp/Fnr family transcriptional regulator [Gammaproteobacteria bacterium]MBU1960260.1 Crp/Fnr family transcriptional regulator [Gammaproteobacteria bacterium]
MAGTTDLLKHHLLFCNLSEDQMTQVDRHSRLVSYAKGNHVFEQGDAATHFFYLVEGQVKLSIYAASGDEKVIEVIRPGGTFAESLMFRNAPFYPVACQALQDSRLVSIESRAFKLLLRESVDTCLAMLGDLSRRLHGLVSEIDNLSQHSALCRVASYLWTQIPPNTLEFELNVQKQVLASRLSVKPETFSRLIKQLCTDGLIELNGPHVKILNPNGLRALARSCSQDMESFTDSFYLSN